MDSDIKRDILDEILENKLSSTLIPLYRNQIVSLRNDKYTIEEIEVINKINEKELILCNVSW